MPVCDKSQVAKRPRKGLPPEEKIFKNKINKKRVKTLYSKPVKTGLLSRVFMPQAAQQPRKGGTRTRRAISAPTLLRSVWRFFRPFFGLCFSTLP